MENKIKWISCKDKMPEYSGVYIVLYDGEISIASRERLFGMLPVWNYGGYIGSVGTNIIKDEEVTHWAEIEKEKV